MQLRKAGYDKDAWIKLYKDGLSFKKIADMYGYASGESIRKTIKNEVQVKKANQYGITINDLHNRLIIDENTRCWEWQGCLNNTGYGWVGFKKKTWAVHRLFYKFFHDDPGQLQVLHKCDNRKCCNPEHLFLGTRSDNMKDMHQKGRDRHSLNKLKNNQNANS